MDMNVIQPAQTERHAEKSPISADRDFNPWQVSFLGNYAKRLRTRALLLLFPILSLPIIAACAIEGTIGSEFRPILDLRLALGADSLDSPAYFPLTRDTPSIWFLVAIVLTCMVVHRQWTLMTTCVSRLTTTGVIAGKQRFTPPRRNLVQRLVGQVIPPRDKYDNELEIVLDQMRRFIRSSAKHSWLPAAVACTAAYLLTVGEQKGLFTSILPDHLDAAQRAQWLDATYNSWWASNNHPLGLFVYFAIASFGIYVVIVQNIVGIATAYFVIALFSAAHVRADWLNRDGRYGWRPIAEIFRTVYLSLLLHGFTLAIILVAIGPAQYPWIAALLGIWLVVTPLYLLAPVAVFRRVANAAKTARHQDIAAEMATAGVTHTSTIHELQPYAMEIDRVNAARIRPLRVGAWGFATACAVVVLPVALAILQSALGR